MQTIIHVRRAAGAIWLVALVLAVALLLVMPPGLARACTQPPDGFPEYTTTDYVENAEVVFEGVIQEQSTQLIDGDTIKVRVDRYFKIDGDDGPSHLTLVGYGPSSLCLSPVATGQRLIFFAEGDPSTGVLAAVYLTQFDAVHAVSDEYVEELLEITGNDPVISSDAATPAPPRVLPNDMTVAAMASNTPTGIPSALLTPGPTLAPSSPSPPPTALGSMMTVGFVGLLVGITIGIALGLRAALRQTGR